MPLQQYKSSKKAHQSTLLSILSIFMAAHVSAETKLQWKCPGALFTQQVIVFDALQICSTEQVPQKKLLHAANVTAQWLDNNQDGKIDQESVSSQLKKNKATLVMSLEGFSDKQYDLLERSIDQGYALQDLSAEETNPANRRDASQEEIHHLLISTGWAAAYPSLFSTEKRVNSVIYQQWRKANRKGFYAYGDPTCDAECKTMEFHYLAAAAYLGSKADLFSDEMRLKSRHQLRSKMAEVVDLFESEQYHYPKHRWPNGDYPYSRAIDVRK